jgi:hypothetical protein
MAGEPAVGLTVPAAYEPTVRGKAVEAEQAYEVDGRRVSAIERRADGRAIENGESALAPEDREGHGSHTLSPRPAQPDGAAKGGDPLVGGRHGRQGTD